MDSAVYDELARLETAAGIDVNCTISADYISGTTKVQMGDSVTVNLEYPTNFGINIMVYRAYKNIDALSHYLYGIEHFCNFG